MFVTGMMQYWRSGEGPPPPSPTRNAPGAPKDNSSILPTFSRRHENIGPEKRNLASVYHLRQEGAEECLEEIKENSPADMENDNPL